MNMAKETILLASDHNGNEARRELIKTLKSWGYSVVDMGPRSDDSPLGKTKVDYTTYAEQLAFAISQNSELKGILICGTGVGMSIAANRFKGVKASLVHDAYTAKMTREHNDSNVLVLGAWNTPIPEQKEILKTWLNQEFGKGRHEKRVAVLDLHDPEDVVLVPGVFEILQPGHIKLLEFAKSLGRVVVALNSDKSTKLIKGRKPVLGQNERAFTLMKLNCVDEVIIMEDDTPASLLRDTNAKYIVKGGQPEQAGSIVAHDNVPPGCEVKMFPIDHSYSTQKIRDAFGD